MHEIVFLDASTVGDIPELELLKTFGTVKLYAHSTHAETAERVKNCTILLSNKSVVDQAIIESAPFLKLICVTATGMNNIDIVFAEKRKIAVKNVSGYSTNSVAQVTLGSLLYLINQIPYYDQYVKSGNYCTSPIFTNIEKPFSQIHGKTWGIIGLGMIGKQVARIADAFGAKVVYYSTSGKNFNQDYPKKSLNELLNSSDIVSIHAPLNDATRNLLDYTSLKLMKPSSILINTGRGGIINESDLAQALNENLIYAAALDVLEYEPIQSMNPLLQIINKDRLLITPHIAWASIEARKELMKQTFLNIQDFINNS